MEKQIIIAFISFSLLAIIGCKQNGEFVKPADIHWEYENPNWQSEGYGDCAGKVQTPIDINTSKTVKADLGDVSFNYSDFAMKIIDNGHTIQVNNSGNSTITLNGATFAFKQFHFHHHSEHQINGQKSDMELHLVHADDATGNITVLGIMLEEGAENPFITKVWANIPTTKKAEVTTSVTLNLSDILPTDKKYYTYTGSLTTPPCSQGLQWILFKEPVQISKAQAEAFAALYEDNARPIQPLNNRLVLEKM
ncbi:MAG: carbonic anhydrase [Bacteroidia bacterium]